MRETDTKNKKALEELIADYQGRTSPPADKDTCEVIRKATWLMAWLEHDRNATAAAKALDCDYWQLHRLCDLAKARGCVGACVPVVRYGFSLTEDDRAFLNRLLKSQRDIVRNHALAVLTYHDHGPTQAVAVTGYQRHIIHKIMRDIAAAKENWWSVFSNLQGSGRVLSIDLSPEETKTLDDIIERKTDPHDHVAQEILNRARALKLVTTERVGRKEIGQRFSLSPNTISRLLTTVRRLGVEAALSRSSFFRMNKDEHGTDQDNRGIVTSPARTDASTGDSAGDAARNGDSIEDAPACLAEGGADDFAAAGA